jgi:SAM-dependent methyltransferase
VPAAGLSDRNPFWARYQPGTRSTDSDVGTPEFFAEVERKRYELEPHIPDVVRFDRWANQDVLEAGCGIGTDAMRFLRAKARYTGLDASPLALTLASSRFQQSELPGSLAQGSITRLPFNDCSFDLVFSHGVVHHIPDTDKAVQEFLRVLRPGGTALVMVYHRTSLNYYASIMALRRMLVGVLALPSGIDLVAKVTGEDRGVLEGHRRLLKAHGIRYITDAQLFLSNNTDGPGNPLSKVYSRREISELFRGFAAVETTVRHLNLRSYPGGRRMAKTAPAERLGRAFGWHLYVTARKPER